MDNVICVLIKICQSYLSSSCQLFLKIEPEETPLNTKHAVRCCKDDSPIIDIDDEFWSQKKASCPFTMKQLWTGESQEVIENNKHLGYTLYSNRNVMVVIL